MGVDLDHRDVGVGAAADQLGVILGGGAGQGDLNPVRLLHYVIIGEDVAIRVDNHARAQPRAAPALRTVG